MDLTTLKRGDGFIRSEYIFDRMKFNSPPDGERYYISRIKDRDFAEVGVWLYGTKKKLFHIYAGNRELYSLICEMAKEAATAMSLIFAEPIQIEEWADDTI